MAYLLVYVDGIVLMASSTTLLREIINVIHVVLSTSDLNELHHFLTSTWAQCRRPPLVARILCPRDL
jgi:hypothetical protein